MPLTETPKHGTDRRRKIYCEHGAMSPEIRKLLRDAAVDLVHFPYDPTSKSRYARIGEPSKAQVRDLNLPIKELPGTIGGFSGSTHFEAIVSILGIQNRRDILHVDCAFKTGCAALITADSHILGNRHKLEKLLGIKFFHPEDDRRDLQLFVSTLC